MNDTPHTQATRRQVEAQLEARGVPVRLVHLVPDHTCLRHPRPLRCDLLAQVFAPRLPGAAATGA